MEESRYTIILPAYHTISCKTKTGNSIAFIHYNNEVKVQIKATEIIDEKWSISVFMEDSLLDLITIYCFSFEIYDLNQQPHTVSEFLIED